MKSSGTSERLAIGVSMALAAWLIGFAVEIRHGLYDPTALGLLTAAIAVAVVGIAVSRALPTMALPGGAATAALVVAIVAQVATIVDHNRMYAVIDTGTVVVCALALMHALGPRRLSLPLAALTLVAFALVVSRAVRVNWTDPHIDVFTFQQLGASSLLHLRNPFAEHFPSPYPAGTAFYGQGIVDASNHLMFGFTYPPLSLLMVTPAFAITGDCRYADVAAMAAGAGLMMAARPGRWTSLVALLFLLTPRVFFVAERSWTEPLLALTFSLVMWCALRYRNALPYALGLFFATKQYTIVAIPLVWLLTEGPDRRQEYRAILGRAIAVVLASCAPFLLWNPREFFRSVVAFHFLQPFRQDALTYLVWANINHSQVHVPLWASLPVGACALAFALWRCPRTPAGFAAGMTVVYLLFFAFSKQAFCNYYYFAIATACWAALASINAPASAESASRLAPG